jgi:bacterioferritin
MKLASTGLEAGLQKVVKEKQGYISQYQAHHVLQKRWGYHKLAKLTKGIIDDDRDHLKATLHYMARRDIIPKMDREEADVKDNVPDQIAADLKNEKHCVEYLNEQIIAARHAGEDSLRRVLEHIVKDDEKHVADLETQQNLIKTLGLPNYLARVSKV